MARIGGEGSPGLAGSIQPGPWIRRRLTRTRTRGSNQDQTPSGCPPAWYSLPCEQRVRGGAERVLSGRVHNARCHGVDGDLADDRNAVGTPLGRQGYVHVVGAQR